MINIRRNILYKMRGDAAVVKALSLALFYKYKYASSTITNYSANKIRKQTGLSYGAIRSRVKTLVSLGFAHFEGKNKERLVFTSTASKCRHRNIQLDTRCFDSIKDIENMLWLLFFAEIQKRKDFVRQTLHSATNPENKKEMSKARKICRRYGYDYAIEYKEFGISYKTIANAMGVCLQKAFGIINWAVEKCIISKTKRQLQRFIKGVGYIKSMWDESNATFITNNNAYKIYANVYSFVSSTTPTPSA